MTEPREQEIDLRRYWDAIAARWWLLVAGLALGVAIAYAISLGGADVWRGQALVYLGQPVTPSGAQVQSLSTNPAAAGEIAGSAGVQRFVERRVGMRRGELAGKVSVAAVKGNLSRLGQNPLLRVRVEGDTRHVAEAATLIAGVIVDRVSDYADAKVTILEAGVAALERDLEEARRRSDDSNVLLWRAELTKQLLDAEQTLALATDVERAQVVEEAVARKVTAQSRRNQVVVGGFLGLLIGLAAALAWESAAALRRP